MRASDRVTQTTTKTEPARVAFTVRSVYTVRNLHTPLPVASTDLSIPVTAGGSSDVAMSFLKLDLIVIIMPVFTDLRIKMPPRRWRCLEIMSPDNLKG